MGVLFFLLPLFSNAQYLLDPASASGPISIVTASSSGTNTSIAVAYSIRQLKTTYDHTAITPPTTVTGFTNSSTPLLRVRRSFDNAQLDIGYDGNGNLDTVTLKNFVTGKVGNAAATNPTANGRVSIFYDQSGNSRDASVGVPVPCPSQASEPYIVTAGVIERNGGGQVGIAGKNGGMLSDGGTAFDAGASGFNRYGIVNDRTLNVVSQPRAWSTVGGSADGNGTYLVDRNGGVGIQDAPLTCIKAVGNNWAAQIRNESGDISQSFAGIIPISVNRSDNVTIIRSGNNYPMYVNGVLAGTGVLSGNNSQSPVRIGYGCQYGENVYYGELILFPSALSNADLAALNTSQNSYYALGATPGLWTGNTSTNWAVASNWSNNTVPDAITEVQIPSGTLNNLVITGGQTAFAAKSLSVDAGATVTITGNLNVTGNVIVNGTISGTGTLSLTGSLDQTISGTPAATISNLIIANVADTVIGTTNLNLSGTLTVNSGAVFAMDAAAVVNNAGAAGTLTGSGTVLATRITSVSDFQNQYKFSAYTLSGLTVNYAGEGAQIVNLGVNYSNLIVSGSGIKTLSTAVTATNITGNITINAGTLNTNNFNIGSPTNRTITVAAGAILNAGTSVISFGAGTKVLALNGTLQTANVNGFSGAANTTIDVTNTPTVTPATTSTVEYTASAAQAVTARTDYGNVVLSNGSKTITGTNTLAGSLTINTGATYNGAANPVLNIGGNFTNNGTFTSGTGLVTFNGTSAQTVSSSTSPLVFAGSVTFSGASSTATMAVNATTGGNLTVSANKTLDLGTFSFNRASGGGTLLVPGTLKLGANSGGQTGSNYPLNFTTSTLAGGTVEYNGSNAITQTIFATPTYGNLTLTNGSASGNAAKTSTAFTVANGTMTVNAGATISTTGNVTGTTAGVLTGTGTLEVRAGVALGTQYNFATPTLTNLTITYSGSGGTLPAGTYASVSLVGSGATTLSGNIIVTGSVTIGSGTTLDVSASNFSIQVASNFTNNGAFTQRSGTVTFNGTTTQAIGGTALTTFNNIIISNATNPVVLNRSINVSNTLTLNASTSLIPDDTVIINNAAAAGTITGLGTAHVTRTLATADYQNQYKFTTNTLTSLTVNYSGAGNQTVTVGGAGVNYSNLIISGSGTKTQSAAITSGNVTGNITVNAGTFFTNNFNIGSPASRTITVAVGAILNTGTSVISYGVTTRQLTVNGTLQTENLNGLSGSTSTTVSTTNTPTITLNAGSVVEYTGAGGQVVTTGTTYRNLQLSSNSKTIASGTLTVAEDLTIGTGATYLGTTNNPVLNLAGNFINNGTFTAGSGLFTLNGATQTIGGTTTPATLGSLTVSSTVLATLLVDATISGNLNVSTTRIFDLGTFSCNRTAAGGTLTVAGTLKLGANTGGQTGSNFPTNFSSLVFTGGTIEYNGSNAITQTVFATTAYHNLTLTNGSGTGDAAKISSSNFTVASGETMTVGSGVTFTPAVGNVITGTGATLIGTGGTIDVTGGATLVAQYAFGTTTLTNLTVNYSGNGSISPGTYSTLTLNGNGTITLTGNVVVVTDVVIGPSATLASAGFDMDVNGNWTNNGTYTAGGSLVRFVGTSTQTIGGTSVSSFASVTITNTTSPILVNRAISISGTLNLSGAGTNIIPDDTVVITGGGSSTLSGSGTLRVTRIAATADLRNQYIFNTYTLTSATVDYTGLGPQTINNTVGTYGALIVSGTGTKTLQGSITVTNDVTFTSGSFATGGFNLTTNGNIVNNGVTISGAGNFNLNGTTRTISGTFASNFPTLVIGSGATYSVANNNTCAGLTFTAASSSSSFTLSSNNSLIVNGNVTINQPGTTSVTSSWNINAGTVSVTGTLTMGGSNTASRVARIVLTTGTLSIVGSATLTGSATPANTLIDLSGGACFLTLGGAVSVTSTQCTLTPGTASTVTYSGTVAQTIPLSTTMGYFNLITGNGHASGATLGAAITATNLTGDLTVASGTLHTNNVAATMAASRTITVAAGATLNAGTTSFIMGTGSVAININGTFRTANTNGFSGTATTAIRTTNTPLITLGSSSTIEYSGTSQTVTVTQSSGALAYHNLAFSNTSGTNTAGGNVVVNGELSTAGGGTFALSTFTLTGTLTTVDNSGTITTSNTSATPVPTGKTWGGQFTYLVTGGGQTIANGTYNNLTLSNTSGTNTADGDITVNGTLTTTGGGTLALSTFELLGSLTTITNLGTITTANTGATPIPTGKTWNGIVNYNATTGGQNIVAGTYTTLTMGNTSGTQTALGNLSVTTLNNNTNATDILDMETFTLGATTINNSGTIRTQSLSATAIPSITIAGTVTYDALTGGQTIRGNTYTNLTLANTSGTQTASAGITVSGTFTTTAGGTLDMVTFALATNGTEASNGIITTQNTSATPITSGVIWGGTINFSAAGAQTIVAGTYTNLTSSNGGARTLINGGTINVSGVFDAGTKNYTTTGNTFDYNGTGPQTIVSIDYNNLTISGARGSSVITFEAGTLGLAGTATFSATSVTLWDAAATTIEYNGGAQTVSPTFAYTNLTLSGTGTKTTTSVVVNGILSSEGNSTVLVSVAPTFGASATLQFNKSSYPATIGTTDWPAAFAGEGGVILNAASATITLSANVRTVTYGIAVNVTGAFRVNLGSQTHTCNGLTLGGVAQLTGSYNATNTSAFFITGAGQITNSSPVKTWAGTTTSWNTAGNWSPSGIPSSTQDVLIPSTGTQPSINVAATCRSLTINNGATLSYTSGSLSISGDFSKSGTANFGACPITIAGLTNQSFDAFTTTGAISITKTAGTTILNGATEAASVTFAPAATSSTTLVVNDSLTLSGAMVLNNLANANTAATLAGTGIISCASLAVGNGTGATTNTTTRTHTITSTIANLSIAGNLTINGYFVNTDRIRNGVFTHTSGVVSIGGTLTTSNANAANTATYTMGASGPQLNLSGATPFTNTGAGTHTITLNGTGAIVNYNGTSAQVARVTAYSIMKVNNTAGVTLATGTNTIPTLTIGDETPASIFNDGGFAITSPGTLNLVSGTCNISSASLPAWATTNISSGTTVGYTSGSGQVVSITPAYQNLTFSGAGTKTIASGTLNVLGNWNVSAPTTLATNSSSATVIGNISGSGTITPGTGTISLAGSWSNATATLGTGTVNYNGTGAQSIAALTYNNLTVSGARTGSPVITLPSGTINITGTFTNSATGVGSIDVTGNTINYSGSGAQTIVPFSYNNLTVSGARGGAAITLGSGTINIASAFSVTATGIGSYVTTGNTVNYSSTSGTQSVAGFVYNNLTLSNTSGTNTASGDIVVDGVLTQATGGTLDLGAFTLTGFLNTVTNNGTILTTNVGQTPLASGVTWGGTGVVTYLVSNGTQSVMAGTYQNLTISNTSGTQTASGNININNTLSLNGGTLSMGTFQLLGSSLTTSGTGTITTQNTGSTPLPAGRIWNYAVLYTSSSSQTIVSGTYANLTASGGNRTLASSGTIGVSGTFTPGSGTYTVSGSTVDFNGTGAQSIPTITYNNLVISNTRSGSPSITLPAGTITVGGNFTSTTTGVGSFVTAGNTVVYNGVTQSVAGITYGDLTVSGTGLKTLAGNTTVNGTITVGGTSGLDAAGFTLNVLGAWVNNAAFTSNTSTVVMAGSSQQTMSGTVTPVFNALTINNSTGVVMNAAVTVSGALSLTSGKLSVGTNTLTLNGTITSTAANSLSSNGSSNLTIGSAGGNGTIFVDQTVAGTTNKFATVTVNRTGNTITMGNNMEVATALNLTNGKLAIGPNTLTLSGTLANTATNCLVADATSSLAFTGAGVLGSSVFFDQTTPGITNRIVNLTCNRASQTITLGNSMHVTGTVTPTAGTIASAGNLMLISDASGTANVANGGCTTCSYITGNVHVQRYVPSVARRYRFMGSTVQSSTLADWQSEIYITGAGGAANGFDATTSNAPSVYWYDETNITGNLNTGWTAATHTSNTIVPGKGYRVFIRGDRSDPARLTGALNDQNIVTMDLVGVPNQGNISAPVSVTYSGSGGTVYDATNDGWNMVSNPYPCGYNWNAHYDDSSTHANIEPVIWVLSGQSGGYVSYNAFANAGSLTTGIIPAGASFWVKANNNGVPSLTFKEQYKITSAPLGIFKTNEEENFSIRLYYDSITYDDATVKYMTGSTVNYDVYDIRKLAGTVTLGIYGNDNIHLDLSVRPLSLVNDTIKLNVSGVVGAYQLRFNNGDQIAVAEHVFLFDTYLSTVTDLKVTDTYSFNIVSGVPASTGLNRFYIVVSNNASLPVKLLQFNARKTAAKQVTLKWSTANEVNSKEFVVERSADGKQYNSIATVGAAGNTNKLMHYETRDEQPMRYNYYRLKQVDLDGSVYYSQVQYVMMEEVTGAKLYPIPAQQELTLENDVPVKSVKVYDVSGHLVNTIQGTGIITQIDVSKLKTGVYILEYTDETGTETKVKFSKE
ncbi:MAG: T9SS type A sorting domain-containing protein [Bacteroidota bacterium]